MARLPASVAQRCVRGPYDLVNGGGYDPRFLAPLASVRCDLAAEEGATTAWFRLFPRTAGGDHDFAVGYALQGIGGEGRSEFWRPQGDCRDTATAIGTWSSGDVTLGQLACFQRSGESWIYWSYDNTQVLADATRPDGDWKRLAAWWEATARFVNSKP